MCEMPAAYLHRMSRARKEHKCCECRGIISVGELYHVHSGIWDGTPERYKVCEDCERLRDSINAGLAIDERAWFTGLAEFVFESDNLSFIKAFLITKEKRRASIDSWMNERFDDLVDEQEHYTKQPEELFDEETSH